MQSATLAAGNPIEARCSKCRKNTDHIVVTMADEVPSKVQCRVCDHQHKYRPPVAAKKPAAKRAVNRKEDAKRNEWGALRPSMNSAEAKDYSMTGAYKVDTLISHPVFGLGLVQRLVGSRKMEVLFEDGRKTMRCK